MWRQWLSTGTMGILLLACGCGGGDSGPPRFDISGKVTFDNKPVPYGTIQFMPDSTKSNTGPVGYAVIHNGEYSTAAAGGKGVVGGPHQVVVSGFSEKPAATAEVKNPDDVKGSIELFPQYITTKDLKAEENGVNFAITKAAK